MSKSKYTAQNHQNILMMKKIAIYNADPDRMNMLNYNYKNLLLLIIRKYGAL